MRPSGSGPLHRPAHPRVDVALEHLVERRGAAGDEERADHGVEQQRQVGAAGVAQVEANHRRDQHQQVHPRLGERDVVGPRGGWWAARRSGRILSDMPSGNYIARASDPGNPARGRRTTFFPPASRIFRSTRSSIHCVDHQSTGFTG